MSVARAQRGGQHRRIRRDDQVFAKPALEPEAGHAKGLVLVVAVQVARVVRRLGDPPRHREALAVVDLLLHHGQARLVNQRARVAAHDEQRHEVLEHRRAPGQQHPAGAGRRLRAAQPEPVVLRDLADRDRQEAGQTRFGGQRVVVRLVEAPVADVEADREEPARRLEEEREVGLVDQRVELMLEPLDRARPDRRRPPVSPAWARRRRRADRRQSAPAHAAPAAAHRARRRCGPGAWRAPASAAASVVASSISCSSTSSVVSRSDRS